MGGVTPKRGEVWYADLEPVVGREQGGRRPVLIVSEDDFNAGHAELVLATAITSTDRGIRRHVFVQPPEGGLRVPCFIKCEDTCSISKGRLGDRLGEVSETTMAQVEEILRALLDL